MEKNTFSICFKYLVKTLVTKIVHLNQYYVNVFILKKFSVTFHLL